MNEECLQSCYLCQSAFCGHELNDFTVFNNSSLLFLPADSCRDEVKTKSSARRDSKGGDDYISKLLNNIDDDIEMDMMIG